MLRSAAAFAAALLVAPLASAASDPDDNTDCRDHPEVSRFPGFALSECTQNDFNAYEFPLAGEKTVKKEGRFWNLSYALKEGARQPSAVELIRNYEAAFKKRGGRVVFKDEDAGSAVYAMPLGKSERWLHLQSWNSNTAISLTIVELAAMAVKVEVNAREMLDALERDGFVALHGITFDTGKDVIKPESEPQLAEIAGLLSAHPDLKLSVEGHTDNVGDKKANEALSKKRAESVKRWLVGKGVAAARLATNGFGDGKPVADNRTEQGRAQNRRVELVKK